MAMREAYCCEDNPKVFWVVFKVFSGANLLEDAIRTKTVTIDWTYIYNYYAVEEITLKLDTRGL